MPPSSRHSRPDPPSRSTPIAAAVAGRRSLRSGDELVSGRSAPERVPRVVLRPVGYDAQRLAIDGTARLHARLRVPSRGDSPSRTAAHRCTTVRSCGSGIDSDGYASDVPAAVQPRAAKLAPSLAAYYQAAKDQTRLPANPFLRGTMTDQWVQHLARNPQGEPHENNGLAGATTASSPTHKRSALSYRSRPTCTSCAPR